MSRFVESYRREYQHQTRLAEKKAPLPKEDYNDESDEEKAATRKTKAKIGAAGVAAGAATVGGVKAANSEAGKKVISSAKSTAKGFSDGAKFGAKHGQGQSPVYAPPKAERAGHAAGQRVGEFVNDPKKAAARAGGEIKTAASGVADSAKASLKKTGENLAAAPGKVKGAVEKAGADFTAGRRGVQTPSQGLTPKIGELKVNSPSRMPGKPELRADAGSAAGRAGATVEKTKRAIVSGANAAHDATGATLERAGSAINKVKDNLAGKASGVADAASRAGGAVADKASAVAKGANDAVKGAKFGFNVGQANPNLSGVDPKEFMNKAQRAGNSVGTTARKAVNVANDTDIAGGVRAVKSKIPDVISGAKNLASAAGRGIQAAGASAIKHPGKVGLGLIGAAALASAAVKKLRDDGNDDPSDDDIHGEMKTQHERSQGTGDAAPSHTPGSKVPAGYKMTFGKLRKVESAEDQDFSEAGNLDNIGALLFSSLSSPFAALDALNKRRLGKEYLYRKGVKNPTENQITSAVKLLNGWDEQGVLARAGTGLGAHAGAVAGIGAGVLANNGAAVAGGALLGNMLGQYAGNAVGDAADKAIFGLGNANINGRKKARR